MIHDHSELDTFDMYIYHFYPQAVIYLWLKLLQIFYRLMVIILTFDSVHNVHACRKCTPSYKWEQTII